jgi:hypothetical protein
MNSKKTNLSDKKINSLYEKYSYPIMKACITESQKDKAMGISKLLWLFLVTGKDTEENIYIGLKSIMHHHDEVISLGSLYYHKMKKALNQKEIRILKEHYDNPENFNSLTDWGDITLVKERDLH